MDVEQKLLLFFDTQLIPWSINIAIALVIFILGKQIAKFIANLVNKALGRSHLDDILVGFISSMVNAVLLLFVVVAALDRLGINTTSMIAMLGAAGLAVGLALQNSLQNFAAGFMLLIFRPFKAGDYIEAGGTIGTVEKINIFSTVIHSGDNKEIVVPNGLIYNGKIVNYSARPTRRIDLSFNIKYTDNLKTCRDIIQAVIEADKRVLKHPAPLIAVAEIGATTVTLIARPWVNTLDYWPVRFSLVEKIKLAFEHATIEAPTTAAPSDSTIQGSP